MTNADHERERRAFWGACCAASYSSTEHSDKRAAAYAAQLATAKLAERDKMFPAPDDGVNCPLCGQSVIADDIVDQCFSKCQTCGAALLVRAVLFDAIALSAQKDSP